MSYTDATEAHQHLRRLARYLDTATLAHQAGLHPGTVARIVTNPHARITSATHAAVMDTGWDLDQVPDAHLVPGFCVARRLNALACLGWSSDDLAPMLGLEASDVRAMRTRERVPAALARHVRDIYDQLSMRRGPNDTVARTARAAGHRPPLEWDGDSIDLHPDDLTRTQTTARPRTGSHLRYLLHAAPARRSRRAISPDVVRDLNAAGLPDQAVADRLGVALRTIQRVRARHHIPASRRYRSADDIRRLTAQGHCARDIARTIGVSLRTVHRATEQVAS